ncbi:MAG: hypothetical protein KF685_08595 [Acidobacteria bacterium]|nr:hypothetical protein [Acidobacteriota bacterium]
MILAILTAVLAYRRAKESGRSGLLWALAGAGVYIGTQMFVTFAIGIGLGIAIVAWELDENIFYRYEIVFSIIAIAMSLFTSWLLLRYLSREPAADEAPEIPPPPPDFSSNQQ